MASNVTVQKRRKKYRVNEISSRWNIIFIILTMALLVTAILPLALVVVVSFSSTDSISRMGYTFFPSEWSLDAYTSLAKSGSAMVDSYLVTIFYVAAGTAMSLIVTSMLSYAISLKHFKPRRFLAFYVYFTTLFSGGLVANYILKTRYLHMDDTIWIFLLPSMVVPFYVIMLRTFISTSIPDSLFDAAKIDGAGNWTIYCRIVLPLSKAGLATIALFNVVNRWNSWFDGILYIRNPKLTPIMTFLQRIQKNIDFLKNNSDIANTPDGLAMMKSLPAESTRMAIVIIATLPLLVAYPFFQKYFIKGMTVGSVKG